MIFTIDGGTTNTRIVLLENGQTLDRVKLKIGAGSSAAAGSNRALVAAIRDGIATLLAKHGIAGASPDAIYASGMLTSEFGLAEVAHLTAPVGVSELHAGLCTVRIPEISDCPITLIPGVRNAADDNPETGILFADMMRGEETELFGLAHAYRLEKSYTAVLPGTHTKVIRVDEEGRIASCRTTLGGELLAVIPEQTILRPSVPHPLISPDADLRWLETGRDAAESLGVSCACFRARVLATRYGLGAADVGAFLAGAILSPDIGTIAALAGNTPILLGGSEPLRSVFSRLLSHLPNRLIVAEDGAAESATVKGACLICS